MDFLFIVSIQYSVWTCFCCCCCCWLSSIQSIFGSSIVVVFVWFPDNFFFSSSFHLRDLQNINRYTSGKFCKCIAPIIIKCWQFSTKSLQFFFSFFQLKERRKEKKKKDNSLDDTSFAHFSFGIKMLNYKWNLKMHR